jgi:hypothetical protein
MRTLIYFYSILVSGMHIGGSNLLLLSCAGTTTKVHRKFISKVKVVDNTVNTLLSESRIKKDDAPMDGQFVTCGEETTLHLQNFTTLKSTGVRRQVSQVCQAIASMADGIQEFAGIECADEFAARAHDSKDLPFVTSKPIELLALENRYRHVEDAIANAAEVRAQKRAADARSKAALLANRTEEEIEQEEQKKAEARLKANATRRERYASRTADEKAEASAARRDKYKKTVDCDHCGGTYECHGQGISHVCSNVINKSGLKCKQICQQTKIVKGERWRCRSERYKYSDHYNTPYCGRRGCLTDNQDKNWFRL